MNVDVGSWHEPDTFPGLAHFLEHMVFLGSDKYPLMGHFDDFLAESGGMSNAYTDDLNTNYFFEIGSQQLNKALDMFAHFFIDPSFDSSAIELEINAVNSEYQINVSNDNWKIENLLKLFSDPSHPASRFSMGNSQSLLKDGLAAEM